MFFKTKKISKPLISFNKLAHWLANKLRLHFIETETLPSFSPLTKARRSSQTLSMVFSRLQIDIYESASDQQ